MRRQTKRYLAVASVLTVALVFIFVTMMNDGEQVKIDSRAEVGVRGMLDFVAAALDVVIVAAVVVV